MSTTCRGASTAEYTRIGTACSTAIAVPSDLSCAAGLRSRGGRSPGSPKSKSAVPDLNRNGAQGDSSRERTGGWSLTSRSDRCQPRAGDPKLSQNARRKAAATADRTTLPEIRGAIRLTACCTIPPSACRSAVPEFRLPSRPTRTMWALAQVHGGASPAAPTKPESTGLQCSLHDPVVRRSSHRGHLRRRGDASGSERVSSCRLACCPKEAHAAQPSGRTPLFGCAAGNRLERPRGDRAGQYSIRINDHYRACLVWEGGYADDVEIADYH